MNEITDDIITITGHRDYPDRAALYRGLDRLHARGYLFGGARGVDSDALKYISRTQPRSVRTVVVPNRLIDQPAYARQIARQHATRIIELKNTGRDRYAIRNRYMVDNSRRVHAFFDFRTRGGTVQTINYARIKGKDLSVTPMRKFDFEEFQTMSKPRFQHWVETMKSFKVDLSSIKAIILQVILYVFRMTVAAFIESLGYIGVKSLEALWLL